MTTFLTLQQDESVRLNPDQLHSLYAQLGTTTAEDLVCRAIEELAVRLTVCERLWDNGDMEALQRSAQSLVAISEQVGMTSLASVAHDVAATAAAGDFAGTGATLSRLIRIGEKSLTAIWDQQDLSV